MIKHIVFWTLKEYANGASRQENALKIKAQLESCANIIDGILKFEVALAQPGFDASCDVVLYSEFRSKESLDAYQTHPKHVALKDFVGTVKEERQGIDYAIG